ncbi:hypothetical protein SLA2020_428080 [Shorea laevis]
MASTTESFFSPSNPPNSQTENPNPYSLTSMTSAQHYCSIAHDHTLASTPLEPHSYGIKHDMVGGVGVQHAQKLEACRHAIRKIGEDDPFESLYMIDAVQRLGVDNYFQEEIEAILDGHYVKYVAHVDCGHELHEVALRFRLLRQQGYYVPADVFNNFKDKEGKFKKELTEDTNGLMALYEASQLSIEGEDILDEAGSFSEQLLNARVRHLGVKEPLRVVENTLRHPYHKSLARFMVKNFLVIFKRQMDGRMIYKY